MSELKGQKELSEMTINIPHCYKCNEKHENAALYELSMSNKHLTTSYYNYFAICPKTEDIILIRIEFNMAPSSRYRLSHVGSINEGDVSY